MLENYQNPLLIDAIYANKYLKKGWDLQQIIDIYTIVEGIVKQFPNPIEIIEKHHFHVILDTKGNPDIFHAQCINEKNNRSIEINEVWVKRYSEIIGREQAYALHVAHEAFHILEDYEGVKKLFPFHKQQDIFLEIGAHAYARVLTNCNCHPQVIEYLYRLHNMEFTQNQLQIYFDKKIDELKQCHITNIDILL